jgi:hypothetical protein
VVFGDIKTSKDVSPGPFFYDAAKRYYHVRLAWYADALRLLLGLEDDPTTLVLAVESSGVYDSVVYELSGDDLADGRCVYQKWMAEVRQAVDTDSWPGIANGTRRPYFIPPFAKDDPEDGVDEELDFGTSVNT